MPFPQQIFGGPKDVFKSEIHFSIPFPLCWLMTQIAFPPIVICPDPPLSPWVHATDLEIAGPTAR